MREVRGQNNKSMDWSWIGVECHGMAFWSGREKEGGKVKSMDIPRKRQSWHAEENVRNTGRPHTGWLAAQGETDFKGRKTPLSIKARTGHSAFLGITLEAGATKIRTERARMIDCYRQGHREINRGSYFAPAVLRRTSSGSADATANAKLHALVKSNLSRMARGLRGKADGEVIRREPE